MHFTDTQLLHLMAGFFWPLLRISALFIALPLFSLNAVSTRVRLLLSLAVTFVVAPTLPPLPNNLNVFSYSGLLVGIQQLAIGLVSGFILQLVFASVTFGGVNISNSMGLGFASMVDPEDGQQVPIVAQLYTTLCSLLFLSSNAHLLLLEMLVDSFHSLPIAQAELGKTALWSMINWSKQLLAAGILLALPVTASLLVVNISFGVAARTAPQLQIFAIGFPITILLGLLLIWTTLPDTLALFSDDLLLDAYRLLGDILQIKQ